MARKRKATGVWNGLFEGSRMWLRGMKAAWLRWGSGSGARRTAFGKSVADRLAAKMVIRRQVSGLFVLALVSMGAAVSVVSCQSGPALPERPAAPARPVTTTGQEPDIRVRIRTRSPSLTISSPPQVSVRPIAGGYAMESLSTPITVTVSPRGFQTLDASGATRTWGPSADLEVFSATPGIDPDRASLIIDGVAYPGRLTLRGRWRESGQTFDASTALPLETYVAGVLQKELYDGWPRQSYEAQAIAARSYAMHERERARRSSRQYDVESSTLDQAYGGLATRPTAIEAVRATRGMMLMYGGAGGGGVLRAYYSSCCGGRPATASVIWPTRNGFEFNLAPPLQGEPRLFACERAPVFAWQVVRKNDELVRRIRAWAREVGKAPLSRLDRLKSIEIASRNSSLRPNTYKLTDIKGQTFTLSAEEMRVACNAGEGSGAGMLPEIRSGTAHVKSNDLEFAIGASPAGPAQLTPPAPNAKPPVGGWGGGDIVIRGRGFGHGVGMCQYCAKGFAERGQDAVTMLRNFYPGADVQKQY